jgi:hypothetical protein
VPRVWLSAHVFGHTSPFKCPTSCLDAGSGFFSETGAAAATGALTAAGASRPAGPCAALSNWEERPSTRRTCKVTEDCSSHTSAQVEGRAKGRSHGRSWMRSIGKGEAQTDQHSTVSPSRRLSLQGLYISEQESCPTSALRCSLISPSPLTRSSFSRVCVINSCNSFNCCCAGATPMAALFTTTSTCRIVQMARFD